MLHSQQYECIHEDHYLPVLLPLLIRLLISEWLRTGCSPARDNVHETKAKGKLLLIMYYIVYFTIYYNILYIIKL